MQIRIEHNAEIPMRDGTILRADVYLPPDGAPAPAILFRTPYDKTLLSMDALRPLQAVHAGYSCVVQDTRGRFASDGDWGAIAWDVEGPDTYDTIEWIAEQDWCTGNVGMAGVSYLGIVQWLGAMEQPPHLKAIAPIMSTSAEFDAHETGGAFRLDHILSWLAFMAADWLQRRMAAGHTPEPETIAKISQMALNPRIVMEELPIRDNPWFELDGFPMTISDLLDGGTKHAPHFQYERIRIPTLSIGGFFDIFPRATLMQFEAVRTKDDAAVADEHHLIMGPWLHAPTLPAYQGAMNFGLLSAGTYSKLPQKHLQFFDRHLKGEGDPLPRIEYFLAGRNEWRTATSWPPEGVTSRSLFLRSEGDASRVSGVLADEPAPHAEAPDTYESDPMKPVPTHGGRVLYLGGLAPGPLTQNHLEERDDVLVYTGAALEEELVVVGDVSVELFASTTGVDCDWVVKLVDVHPDHRAVLVADGNRRARFREGFEAEVAVPPGQVLRYSVDLGPVAWAFQPGHRLRLHIQSSNFPHLDRNLQTGDPLGVSDEATVATQTIVHTAEQASRLVLPVQASGKP